METRLIKKYGLEDKRTIDFTFSHSDFHNVYSQQINFIYLQIITLNQKASAGLTARR